MLLLTLDEGVPATYRNSAFCTAVLYKNPLLTRLCTATLPCPDVKKRPSHFVRDGRFAAYSGANRLLFRFSKEDLHVVPLGKAHAGSLDIAINKYMERSACPRQVRQYL